MRDLGERIDARTEAEVSPGSQWPAEGKRGRAEGERRGGAGGRVGVGETEKRGRGERRRVNLPLVYPSE